MNSTIKEDNLSRSRATLRARQGWTLDKLIVWVCTNFDIKQEQLLHKARNNKLSKAKALLCYWGTNDLGLSTVEISQRLTLSQQAVSK